MKLLMLPLLGLLAVILVSGCTSNIDTSRPWDDASYTSSPSSTSTRTTEPSHTSTCNREAEAERATSSAMSYCKSHPYGTYRTTVCGVPITINC